MAGPGHQVALLDAGPAHEELIAVLARRLAAAGMGVEVSRHRDTCQFTILGAASGKSLVALDGSGKARWYYEPTTGAAASPATLTAIIAYLLGAPHDMASLAAYRALPLKGQVGRCLQDRGLAVVLQVSEDLESFEATTDIDVTSPARPWLGTVRLSDDAALDWHFDLRAAFRGRPAALIDVIIPVLRGR
ncbi:MAG TPA: hypothetical protein VHZ03_02290 [Trebonia sp.]|jgi:hypothetical protein|nr:hypothetical protein [Trebonia sp.]